MPRSLPSRLPLRATAVWLLVASMLLAPSGVGTSLACSGDEASICCPCEEAAASEQTGSAAQAAASQGSQVSRASQVSLPSHVPLDSQDPQAHDDASPARGDCGNDCPDCNCCRRVPMGFVLPFAQGLPVAFAIAETAIPPQAPASADDGNVFRPPRSRA